MLTLLLSAILALTTQAPPDYGRAVIEIPNAPRLLAVWTSEHGAPTIVQDMPGPGPSHAENQPDHFSAVYVSVGGTLVTVYVDCTKRTSEECLELFKKRYTQLTGWLKIDAEATKAWREAKAR